MEILKIGGIDFSHLIAHNGYAYSPNIIVGEGRDIRGNLTIDILNKKKKIFCKFKPMSEAELKPLLKAIEPYVVTVDFLNPELDSLDSMTAYVGEQKYEYYWVLPDGTKQINGFQINFIEL
jgi:hypothetical protein